MKFKQYNEQMDAYTDFLTTLYNIMMRQCTTALEDQIKLHIDYATANQNRVELLHIIKQLTYFFEDHKKLSDALCEVKEGFY